VEIAQGEEGPWASYASFSIFFN